MFLSFFFVLVMLFSSLLWFGVMHLLVPLHHFLCEGNWSDRDGVLKFKAQSWELTPSLGEQDYEP